MRLGSICQPGDAEVHNLDLALERDHDIRRLDVPMNYTAPMRVLKSAAGLHEVSDFLRQGNRGAPIDQRGKALPLEVLHGNEGRSV